MTAKEQLIPISDRTEGMVDASASYYQESKLFHALQNTQALEYDRVYENNLDLALQLSPLTATWGLVFWEQANGITPNPTGAYEQRRPLILARMASDQNFGAPMVHRLARNFGEEIRVHIDHEECLVTIVFQRGVPAFLDQFSEALESIIHAHLYPEYHFEYHINGALEIETAYRRYLYSLPKAGLTTFCGTLPSIAIYGRIYDGPLRLSGDYHTAENDYKNLGTYAAGPKPFIAIDGRIYDVSAQLEAEVRKIDQLYTETGTVNSGTKPDTVTMGRLYDEAASVQGDNHNADNDYKRCNQIYSGGEPIL